MKEKKQLFIALLPPLDYLATIFAFLIAYQFRDYLNQVFILPLATFIKISLGLAILWPVIFAWLGLYSFSLRRSSLDELIKIILGCSAAVTLSSAFIYLAKIFAFSRLVLLLGWIFSVICIWIFRQLMTFAESLILRKRKIKTAILLVGEDNLVQIVKRGLSAQMRPDRYRTEKIARIEEALEKAKNHEADEIILIGRDPADKNVVKLMQTCESCGVIFKFVPNIFQPLGVTTAVYDLAGVPLIEIKTTSLDEWALILKRAVDLFVSITALILTSPLLLLTAIAIRLDSPGPIFYKDRRVGRNNRDFEVIKFRSMKMLLKDGRLVHAKEDKAVEAIKAQQKNYKLANDPRITRVGHFIRKTSIDELPQFWNVLRGEMSVVGPRAYRSEELKLQQQRYPETAPLVRRLLTVKPGITGIWQVSGRSEIEFSERVAMDAYYASHANLWVDLSLILRTIPAVIKGSGAM